MNHRVYYKGLMDGPQSEPSISIYHSSEPADEVVETCTICT